MQDKSKAQSEQKFRKAVFGVIVGEEKLEKFKNEFQQTFECTFEQVNMVDELFKKKVQNSNIYFNGIRIISYPNQNLPYEIEQILGNNSKFNEYYYSTMNSLEDPSFLIQGLDFESMVRIEIPNGFRVDVPHFGLNVLIYQETVNMDLPKYFRVDFNFLYSIGAQNSASKLKECLEKANQLQDMIKTTFADTIEKYLEIQKDQNKDKRGIDDVKRLRPSLE